jgi:hypothetical protein
MVATIVAIDLVWKMLSFAIDLGSEEFGQSAYVEEGLF